MLATTDQYRYYRSLVKYLKKLYINSKYIYFEQNNILYEHQYGFKKHKSTVQALLNHMQFMYDGIDSGNFVISVFLDFKKEFDTVDHKILLSKFDFYGIRGVSLEFLKSYLSERNQITVIDGITSSSSLTSHGVPQGSVLGRLLFLLFINDLPNSSSLFKFILFADDSTLSTSFAEENALECTLTLNHELYNVNNYLTLNRICINADKTKYMIFSYRNYYI